MGPQNAGRAGPATDAQDNDAQGNGARGNGGQADDAQGDDAQGSVVRGNTVQGNAVQGGEGRVGGVPDPLTEARDQVAELDDRWRRSVAELDNFRKRSARDAAQQRTDERIRVLSGWLPVLDNLERALEHSGSASDGFAEGVRSIRDQALAVVADLGYPRADDLGEQFDPNLHEALGTTPSADHKPGTVVHVVRPRYGRQGQVLRPAAVIVAAEQR